jgi:putative zinc finger/helix-turn-helix YgiT family protein
MMAMLSPITGKPMTIHREWRQMTYRKETFKVYFHTWYCEESGQEFEDDTFAQLNYDQVINQYREKHNIPFPDEIKAIREQYDLSATRMSQALGFGDNTYRQYEAGEIPTEANARLIQLAANPDDFLQLLKLADLPANFMKIACENAEKLIKKKDNSNSSIVSYFFQPTSGTVLPVFANLLSKNSPKWSFSSVIASTLGKPNSTNCFFMPILPISSDMVFP